MADWTTHLPDEAAKNDTGHIQDHNDIVAAISEARTNVDAAEKTATWGQVANRPSTFPPTVGTTATTAAAGNHTHADLAKATDLAALTARVEALETPAG
ncbi:MAG: hypothetical protein ACTH9H_11870 [Galactobacter sp.]